MGKCCIKLKKIIVCEDPTRKSSWNVGVHLPIDQEQFEIVEKVIRSLRNILDSYFVVDLATPLQKITFLQIRRDDEDLWRIELHFEQPTIFSYRRKGRTYIRKHPWTHRLLHVNDVEEAIQIFREILCDRKIPNLDCWKDCTKQICMEHFKHI